MNKKIVATIEARMTSSRLPGKVMLPVFNKPMLKHLVDRLKCVPQLNHIVLATTTNSTDDILEKFAIAEKIGFFRGSEENVMERVLQAASSVEADIIVEVTGDCPIIDPEIIEQVIQLYLNNECDYASNVQIRSYPIGMDTQVFSTSTLKRSYEMTNHPLDREHVTRHIRQNPALFKQLHLVANDNLYWPELGLTLDVEKDYELLKRIINYFNDEKPKFNCKDIVNLLKNIHPEWCSINHEIIRKGLDN